MPVFGLVGDPVDFSLSPPLYRHLFPRLGMTASYQAFSVPVSQLEVWLLEAHHRGIGLLHVTAPHKRRVARLMDELTPEARRAGAVNVVCSRGGKLVGHLTDGLGLVASLREGGWEQAEGGGVIFGTGGTAAAVASALAQVGVPHVHLVYRRGSSLDPLLAHLREFHPHTSFSAAELETPLTRGHLGGADLIIDTRPPTAHIPCFSPQVLPSLRPGVTLCDVNYRPPYSPFVCQVVAEVPRVLDGIGMFIHQAALSLEWYLGQWVDPRQVKACLPEGVRFHRAVS